MTILQSPVLKLKEDWVRQANTSVDAHLRVLGLTRIHQGQHFFQLHLCHFLTDFLTRKQMRIAFFFENIFEMASVDQFCLCWVKVLDAFHFEQWRWSFNQRQMETHHLPKTHRRGPWRMSGGGISNQIKNINFLKHTDATTARDNKCLPEPEALSSPIISYRLKTFRRGARQTRVLKSSWVVQTLQYPTSSFPGGAGVNAQLSTRVIPKTGKEQYSAIHQG